MTEGRSQNQVERKLRPGRRSRRRAGAGAAVVLFALVLLLVASGWGRAQAGPQERPTAGRVRPAETVTAFVGGTVFPISGPVLRRGTVIIRGAKIEAVGVELPVPTGAAIVDVTGKYVMPGLVAVEAVGVGAERPSGNFADSLDPYGLSLRVALASGVTTANLLDVPFPGVFMGEPENLTGVSSAIVKFTCGDLDSMLVREPGMNYLSMPVGQVELSLHQIREGFRKAVAHLAASKDAAARKQQPPPMPPEITLYVAVLENARPTVVFARTPFQIRAALAIHGEFSFDMILSRSDDGVSLARELAAKSIPVLLKARGRDFDFDLRSPVLDKDGLVPVRTPAAFAEVGVDVVLLPYRRGVSFQGLAGRDLTAYLLEAAFAVRGGLDERSALEAITLRPARVLRIDDRVGSLETGKDADILILDRHPLDSRAHVEKVYINGRLYFDLERSTLFRLPERGSAGGEASREF